MYSRKLWREKELKGTQTEKNLQTAFAGESQARNKYTYFASVAKKEGYEQISAIFLETAENEKEHAKMWFKELGELGDTESNSPFHCILKKTSDILILKNCLHFLKVTCQRKIFRL